MAETKPVRHQIGFQPDTAEENVETLHGFEVEKIVNPDGSYTEIITDHENNRIEINEYDAQGNWAGSTHGILLDEPADSGDSFDN